MAELELPKKISKGWLQKKREVLAITIRQVDGVENPAYADLRSEIEVAEKELSRWEEFESWVKAQLGLALNVYPLRAKGETFAEGQVFLKKDKATGQVTYLTRKAAWEKFAQANHSAVRP